MKRKMLLISLFSLLFLIALLAGCGSSKNQVTEGDNQSINQADHDNGVSQGYSDGSQSGYADGKKGVNNPQAHPGSGVNAEFALGYAEGFANGYEDGYTKAVSEAGSGNDQSSQDKAAAETAMLSFVKSNAVPGLEFQINNIVIHGNEAAGIAVCTSEKLENALVLMKKDASGWHGVDFGTGIDAPSWYSY